MEIYPEEGFAVFVSANAPAGGTLLDKLPDLLLDFFYPKASPAAPRAKDAQAEGAKVAGVYRWLRVPTYRSEAPLIRYVSEFAVGALPSGNIVIAGDVRYKPLGDGVFGSITVPARIAFHELDGRMRMFDSLGVSPADRIGFFESGRWLRWIGGAAAVLALWAVVAAGERFIRGDRRGRAAATVLDALSLAWLAAGAVLFFSVRTWTSNNASYFFTYPGILYPIACSALLLITVAKPVAAVFAFTRLRPTDWSRWLWCRNVATLVVYAALIVTLLEWRLLGFS